MGGTNGFKVANYEARGGGYIMAVPGVVTKLAGKRVEIAVAATQNRDLFEY
jgi:hypothetical protein